ncbi:type I restriction-modification system S subunit [Nostoc sp. NIES-4103]|nr:type I restriction-modification system S subunit [Nostoc sp. NIES-4103]
MAFPKYDSYKDSGVDWLGEIPEDWQIIRAKYVLKEVDERSKTGKEELLSVSHLTGVTPRNEKNVNMFLAEDYSGSKLCQPNDIVVNTMWAWMGALGVSPVEGIVSSSYGVYRPNDTVFPKFLDNLLRTSIYIAEYNRRSTGVHSSRLRLYPDKFLDIPLLLPPLNEQERISEFIDNTTAEIDEAIAKKQRLIELLQEQKAILINQAVTKGLNPKAPMRDSGVEWLGEIPEHWKKIKLKYFIDLLSGFAFKSSSYSMSNEDIPLLRGININPRTIKWDETVYWPKEKVNKFENYLLEENDIVIGMDRPWISSGIRIARIKYCDLPCLLLQRVARIRAIKPLTQAYLELILNSKSFHSYFEPMLTGISVPHISPEQIKIFETYIPDEFEQNIICNFVEQMSRNFDIAKRQEEKKINILEELKSILIAEAVTGKIKV